ncbi:hypothetical protein SPRG_19589, partial [Saprolegnia parasitica CBS 223.65]
SRLLDVVGKPANVKVGVARCQGERRPRHRRLQRSREQRNVVAKHAHVAVVLQQNVKPKEERHDVDLGAAKAVAQQVRTLGPERGRVLAVDALEALERRAHLGLQRRHLGVIAVVQDGVEPARLKLGDCQLGEGGEARGVGAVELSAVDFGVNVLRDDGRLVHGLAVVEEERDRAKAVKVRLVALGHGGERDANHVKGGVDLDGGPERTVAKGTDEAVEEMGFSVLRPKRGERGCVQRRVLDDVKAHG